MKHFRRLSIGAAFILSLSLLAPLNADAASSPKSQSTTQSQAGKSSGKSVKSASKNKSEAKSGKKSVSAKKDSKAKSIADNDRALWQKRARESEIYTGKASWYGKDFHNKATASGLDYDMYTFTAAHRTLPLGTVVKVTDQHNGKSVMVCVTDRGPYVQGRIIDLSYAAAQKLDIKNRGVCKVALEVISDETGTPLKKDKAYFVKYVSDNGKSSIGPFNGFADAAAMHEAISQAHPEAEVVLENSKP